MGTIEPERNTLAPKPVKIVKVEVIKVGKNDNEKVACSVQHPDAEDTISISSVSYLKDKKVVTTGLWFNTDKENLIQKGSALATFLNAIDAKTLGDLEGKEVETELDNSFLCFKAY